MGYFLWGIALGWAARAIYWYSQVKDGDAPATGAAIVFLLLGTCAVAISIGLSAAGSGTPPLTPTPTSLGR